jgi:hypothetical protein
MSGLDPVGGIAVSTMPRRRQLFFPPHRDQPSTQDIGHGLRNMVPMGWTQPDRSAEGSQSDSCGAAMTAGFNYHCGKQMV